MPVLMMMATFTLQSAATAPCHEQITLKALQGAGWPAGAVALPATPEEDALKQTAPFDAADLDPWQIALLIGVRDNDLHGVSPTDLSEFAAVHQSAAFQEEHCLRAPGDEGDGGDVQAIARCRAFILSELALARGGAGVGEEVEIDAKQSVRVQLVDGASDVLISRYAFHLGRAVHALQDSFTHTLRSREKGKIEHVLNYVDPATDGNYDPEVDGYPHESSFDSCGSENAVRVEAAIAASTALFVAMNDNGTAVAAANVVLDDELAVDPRCLAANDWCGSLSQLPAGCSTGGGDASLWVAAVLMALPFFKRRSRRKRLWWNAVALGALITAQAASAGELAAESTATMSAAGPFALAAHAGLAVDKGGVSVGVGARWRPISLVSVGVDADFNPWFDLLAGHALPGVATASVTATGHWLEIGGFGIESVASLGASVLLFDAVGAHRGDIGPNLGISLLALRAPLASGVALIVEPAKLTVAVPHLGGVPYAYREYSITTGLEWSL